MKMLTAEDMIQQFLTYCYESEGVNDKRYWATQCALVALRIAVDVTHPSDPAQTLHQIMELTKEVATTFEPTEKELSEIDDIEAF